MEVSHGDCAEDLLVPEVEGMSFKGWLTEEGEYYDFSAPVTGDLVLYGVYGYAVAFCFGIHQRLAGDTDDRSHSGAAALQCILR